MSDKQDIKLFELLKKEVSSTFRRKHQGCSEDISQWKGKEIKLFQEHLEETVQGRISEKWFYTHLKSTEKTLPRIDILNMLSRYCNYEDWIEFRQKNIKKTNGSRIYKYAVPVVLLSPLLWYAFVGSSHHYSIKVVDAITLQEVPLEKLEVTWLKKDESPLRLAAEAKGTFYIETSDAKVELIIKSPYYFTDTLKRSLPSKIVKETILLRPNDFALMINLFSKSKVKEWEKRRERLDKIFAHNASIFQVDENGMGMEIYNKQEFIDKLSYPYSKLKNIEVLETRLHKDKIVFLRFKAPVE